MPMLHEAVTEPGLPPWQAPLPARVPAPTWSLCGLRMLVGHALERAPEAVAALTGQPLDRTPRCQLLFDAIALALVSEHARRALDGMLASMLARDAAFFAGLPLAELARIGAQPLPVRRALALVWLLGRHPCWAARRLEERAAARLERQLAAGH
jgi:hypothetical protein